MLQKLKLSKKVAKMWIERRKQKENKIYTDLVWLNLANFKETHFLSFIREKKPKKGVRS